ncbi:MAG: hypothetical protein KAQ97_09680, partial [Candidatus Fermentibacteraceae bacterium]|nr:hypothetical protein [Candidatus Fermentibacteraceae bacterium]
MLRILLVPLVLITFAVNADVLYRSEEYSETAEYIGLDSEGILVEFTLPALTEESLSLPGFHDGSLLRVPGEGIGMPCGAPDLPVIRRMVLVPNTGDISVEIVSSVSSPLGIFSIPPFQPYPTRSGDVPPFKINNGIYSNSTLYPSRSVVVESTGILRDIRIAWVSYYPVQYNPVTGETIITTNVTVRLIADGIGENELQRVSSGITRSFISIYEQVLGYDRGGSDAIDGSYLVIGSNESIALAQNLIDWKQQRGLQVEYGIVPDIGSNANDIDDWIENAFNTWSNPPEWILIVGDENVVPPPYASGTEADNQYGVIGSGVDPSIHVGRICGGDTNALEYMAWKIEQYEKNPFEPVDSWFQHAISIGSTDFQDPWMSWRYANIFLDHGMPTTLYCNSSSYGGIPPTISNISAEVNSGLSLLSYIGHGSLTAWGTTGFSNSNVDALSNGRRLPWISSIACQNTAFDGSTTCFGEAWMSYGSIASPKGAIGFMGATMNSPVGPTDSLALYQFKGY